LGTLKTQTDALTEAIDAKKTKLLNFQEINENAALIINNKAKLLRQAQETLNGLDQTTYTGASGNSYQTTDIKRILEKNIAFNANLLKAELVRAHNIANITQAHANGTSAKDLQAMNTKLDSMQKLFECEQQLKNPEFTPDAKGLIRAAADNLQPQVDQKEYQEMRQEIEKQFNALMN
jgi:hypothetical protein